MSYEHVQSLSTLWYISLSLLCLLAIYYFRLSNEMTIPFVICSVSHLVELSSVSVYVELSCGWAIYRVTELQELDAAMSGYKSILRYISL